MATSLQRTHAAGLMRWLVKNEPLIDYVQRRPMLTAGVTEQDITDLFAAGRHISTDCSETTTLVCRLAGFADPNGLAYNGAGFTGTMLAHLPHYSDPSDADTGALVVFGRGNGNHVCQVMTPGADPWLFSHGSQSGPKRVRFSTELAVQTRLHADSSYTFLSVAEL